MERVLVELACRYFAPPSWDTYRWRTTHIRQWIDVPTSAGERTRTDLPPGFFTDYGAWTWRMDLQHDGTATQLSLMTADGVTAVWGVEWPPLSSLWSQHRFTPPYPFDVGGVARPWWFRWRCPDAPNDILAEVVEALAAIDREHDAARMETDEDRYLSGHWDHVRGITDRLRREITVHQLGGVVPRRRQA